jgi:hypothetical protein
MRAYPRVPSPGAAPALYPRGLIDEFLEHVKYVRVSAIAEDAAGAESSGVGAGGEGGRGRRTAV